LMRMSTRRILFLHFLLCSLISLSVLALSGRQQRSLAVITGRVVEAVSMKPAPGVEVSWKSQKARSDQTGRYQISIPAGIHELSFSASGHPAVRKLLVVRQASAALTLDVLLPSDSGVRHVLALDRGSRLNSDGKELDSDFPSASTISLADEYGNEDHLLTLGPAQLRVHGPIWLDPSSILFGREGTLHIEENYKFLGIFQFQIDGGRVHQIASQVGVHFLSKSPKANALVAGDQKNLFVMDSVSDASLRPIFSLGPNQGFLLSVVWGPDGRIYFTVDDSIQIDDRRFLTKSRIASIKPDGSELNPTWAADTQYSYRYPVRGEGQQILLSRFSLDGKEQTLWSRDIATGKTQQFFEGGLRAVYRDPKAGRLYYIYQQQLHLKDLKTGDDFVIVNSVNEADYFR
jgi:hypothetical protein